MRTRKSRPTTLPLGTISEGTLRPEDLLSAYLDTLDGIRLTRAERADVRGTRHRLEHPDRDTWDDLHLLDAQDLESLTAILENHVPDYCYFGTAEGDGACFGVWPAMDSIQEESRYTLGEIASVSELPKATKNSKPYAAIVTDHGNVTLYRRAGNRWVEVWSVV